MTFILNRPAWANTTAVKTRNSEVIHEGVGWSAGEGARTGCERTLKDYEFEHIVSFATATESFPGGRLCKTCHQKRYGVPVGQA